MSLRSAGAACARTGLRGRAVDTHTLCRIGVLRPCPKRAAGHMKLHQGGPLAAVAMPACASPGQGPPLGTH